ncbi:Ppx/GppA phosphatase family protein [Varibaculum cambriense]|uniref:Ppx/GppA phosphatase family protein n=1 Tax=Varibaculum cambriense TaxID=184870 RepID=UPI0029003A19|nr:Ppx/GppA phosphatase family protein [Varibaculum cambriense]MDU1224717.1 Ppx/GppA phosphatase family protein [Varibaculum cambriense]MDU3274209.1 Ppx/GppA phosphatase family protein [Varibaculum cambriense]
MALVAGIDCGTNSIRLIIADRQASGEPLNVRTREMRIVRLGEGIDKTGQFAPAALERCFAAVDEYAQIISKYGADKIRFVATSASRDAGNRDEFFTGIKERLGVTPEVISGEEEATLSFSGATSSFRDEDEPVLVVDIGGGSTEFVLGQRGRVIDAISTNMGSVRIFERYLAPVVADAKSGDGSLDPRQTPGIAKALIKAANAIDQLIDEADKKLGLDRARTLIGVAGTVTTITAHALGLNDYEPEKIHGSRITPAQMLRSCNWMMNQPVSARAALGYMPTGRADVIGAGALVWSRIIERINGEIEADGSGLKEILTSETDILDGIALSLLP